MPTGLFQFTSLAVGSYDLTASAQGFQPQTASGVSVTDGGTTFQDFALVLAPVGTLRGTVTDAATTNTIAGAQVAAGTATTLTDANGLYQFTSLAVGSYDLTASAQGFRPRTAGGVSVTDGGTTFQDFALAPAPSAQDTIWVEDSLPGGATPTGVWDWINANPAPFSGASAHQSTLAPGLHQHYFTGATQALVVNPGDTLFAYVYLDPVNTPTEIMLQWYNGNGDWKRAYWGANNIHWGVDDTESRRSMGALPAAGQWVSLEIPASAVGLEGSTITGMGFTLYDGQAAWDLAGKTAQATGTLQGTVTDAATTNTIAGAQVAAGTTPPPSPMPTGCISSPASPWAAMT